MTCTGGSTWPPGGVAIPNDAPKSPKKCPSIGGMLAQGLALAQSIVMLTLVASGHVQSWHLIAANLALGIVNAFDSPARQAQLVELVGGKEDLPNAIALNSIQFNLARVIGPVVAGVALASFGMVACFGLNGISFLFVIAAIFALRD